jgi:hypothetical protein
MVPRGATRGAAAEWMESAVVMVRRDQTYPNTGGKAITTIAAQTA